MEISFFLDENALIALGGKPPSSEASFLESFDQNREHILRAARKVYERRRKGSAEPGPAVEATSSSSWREGFLQICAVALKGH